MSESHDPRRNGSAPELSVILVISGQRERAAQALGSVLSQTPIDRMEVLLFDLGPEAAMPIQGSDHPRVKLTRSGPNDTLAAARLRGVRSAIAPIVAFIEEHCKMSPGWAEAIIAAHRQPWAAVGPDLVNGNPGAGISDKVFRMNYGTYVRPIGKPGPIGTIAGQNSAFKREILLRYEADLELLFYADLVLQWKMQKDGYELYYEPGAQVAHRNEHTLESLATGAFYWSWCFANVRAVVFQWGFFRRGLWIAILPLIPWIRLAKMSRRVFADKRASFIQFLRDVPFILTIQHVSAAGQVAGLFNRLEYGARKFSDFEMNEPRLTHAEWTR